MHLHFSKVNGVKTASALLICLPHSWLSHDTGQGRVNDHPHWLTGTSLSHTLGAILFQMNSKDQSFPFIFEYWSFLGFYRCDFSPAASYLLGLKALASHWCFAGLSHPPPSLILNHSHWKRPLGSWQAANSNKGQNEPLRLWEILIVLREEVSKHPKCEALPGIPTWATFAVWTTRTSLECSWLKRSEREEQRSMVLLPSLH